MASASALRGEGATRRIKAAAQSLYSENQSLLADIRKALNMVKEIAVDLERDNEAAKVTELEKVVVELLESYENCGKQVAAIESVGNTYQPGEELTDFKKLLETEFVNQQARSSLAPPNHSLMRQFREAVWNVHHAGQLMPGDEQEDIIVTSSQFSLLNMACPLTGKPVIELAEPVCGVECKHIYEKVAIMDYISRNSPARCPMSGCPRILQTQKVVSDPLLLVEIADMRSSSKQNGRTNVVEDFTALDDDEEEKDT